MEAYLAGLELNTLQLLRTYTASHAVFNGLAAMQHALLRHEREQGLYILNLFSGYLRKLSSLCQAPNAAWLDEQASMVVYADLENLRYRPECSIVMEEIKSSFLVPSFICIPMLERQLFRALRAEAAMVLKITTDTRDGYVQVQVQADKAMPAFAALSLNSEQRQRMMLLDERLQLFGNQVSYTESSKGLILKLTKHTTL
jgi:LytS/YehU family sensor histidine kinase